MPLPSKIVILGGGISGLTAAWYLEHSVVQPTTVTVLEKGKRPGGWIATDRHADFLLEKGPRSLRVHASSQATLELIQAAGLAAQVIGDAPAAQHRYLWDGQCLQKAPSSLWKALTAPLTRDLITTVAREWWRPKGSSHDESVHAFISRRYSPEVAARLFDPMLSGIYAGDIHQLSARACLPMLWEWEQKHGSILQGMLRQPRSQTPLPLAERLRGHALFTLQDGLATLPAALARQLSDVRLNISATQLTALPHGIRITLDNGTTLDADHVISTLPAHALAPLLATATPTLAQQLKAFKTASLAVVHLAWQQALLPHQGFGYLVASRLHDDILGTVFDSAAFPSQSKTAAETRLTVMLGGQHRADLPYATPSYCIELALRAVYRHLGIHATPAAATVTYARQAIPQYQVGHCEAVCALRQAASSAWPQLTLLGPAFDGVAVNACITHARNAAHALTC